VGLSNTAVTYLAFLLLNGALGLDEYWANASGYAVGLANSFLWNKLWTFRSRGFRPMEALSFLLVAGAAYLVQLPCYRLLRDAGMAAQWAELLAMAPYTATGFLGNKYITFRDGVAMRKDGTDKKPVALVTGASSGIGACLARELAARGYPVALAARGLDKLEAAAAAIRADFGVEAWAIRADLSVTGGAAALYQECARRGIEVGVLVNNAGAGLFCEALDLAKEDKAAALRAMIGLNVTALTELCALFGRDMAGRGRGRILNVASMVAFMPVPYFSAYAASKAYVRSFSASLRAELRPRGVLVSCLFPGYVRTNFDVASQADSPAYRELSYKMGASPEMVARAGARLLESGAAERVAGAMNRAAAFFIRFIPKGLMARVTYSFLTKTIEKG
jgi:short-subunit dehydrogenase/putative flippase GtrA